MDSAKLAQEFRNGASRLQSISGLLKKKGDISISNFYDHNCLEVELEELELSKIFFLSMFRSVKYVFRSSRTKIASERT